MVSARWEARPATRGATTPVPLVHDFLEKHDRTVYPSHLLPPPGRGRAAAEEGSEPRGDGFRRRLPHEPLANGEVTERERAPLGRRGRRGGCRLPGRDILPALPDVRADGRSSPACSRSDEATRLGNPSGAEGPLRARRPQRPSTRGPAPLGGRSGAGPDGLRREQRRRSTAARPSPQRAPRPLRTVGTVRRRIFRSRPSDQLSM